MQYTRFTAGIALLAFAVPVALAASIAPAEYRECMRAALDARESALIDSLRQYNDGHEQALDERKQRYVEAYDGETDAEIRDRLRDADRDYGRRLRDLKEEKRDRDKDAIRTYNDARRACRDLRRELEREQRRVSAHRPGFRDCDDLICPFAH